MKYDYSMSDGDFYRTYGMSQEQAAASESSWGATEYVVLAGVVGAIWFFWPSKPAKKYKFKSLYKEAPVAAAFKYA
jgi:hypothetical protein|tara:strand:- start:2487 stop:2714 length:228 start_codon:yes stop_codon:yes gene_type:complete